MPIINKSVVEITPRLGGYRARFVYQFADGREVFRKIPSVDSQADADVKLLEIESDVLLSVQGQDAAEAVDIGTQDAYKEASAAQVQYAWLKAGFDEDEHYKAYEKIKDIGPQLLALGLTDEEYAAMLNTTVDDATATREYWEFLDANKAVIEAYAAIAGVEP